MLNCIGPIRIHFSPGSIFRTFLTAPKVFSGTAGSIEKRIALCRQYDRGIYARSGQAESVKEVVAAAHNVINELRAEKTLAEDEADFLARRAATVSDPDNQNEAERLFQNSHPALKKLVADRATQELAHFVARSLSEQGINIDWLDVDLTDSAVYGNANFGKYLPHLRVIGVQIDVILKRAFPALQLVDTIVHEEVHGFIDSAPRLELPEPLEEEAAEHGASKWIEVFLARQKRGFFPLRKFSDKTIAKIMRSLWINDRDLTRHVCILEQLDRDEDWGLKLMLALKDFSADDRAKADQAPEVINRAIQQIWPGTNFRLPFYCREHKYGIS